MAGKRWVVCFGYDAPGNRAARPPAPPASRRTTARGAGVRGRVRRASAGGARVREGVLSSLCCVVRTRVSLTPDASSSKSHATWRAHRPRHVSAHNAAERSLAPPRPSVQTTCRDAPLSGRPAAGPAPQLCAPREAAAQRLQTQLVRCLLPQGHPPPAHASALALREIRGPKEAPAANRTLRHGQR